MQIANLKNVELHWREDGKPNGFPIVFANSLGTDLRLWDDVVSQLPSEYRVIRFDKRGHGLSSCPPGPYSMDDLTDDTEQLLEFLKINSCVFVGVSIGGMIGQNLANRRSDLVRAMVLSNTAPVLGKPKIWDERVAAIKQHGIDSIAGQILERWFSADYLINDEAVAWRNMLARTPQDGYIACCQAIAGADLSKGTASLNLPVLVIAGSEDQASPPDVVENTANIISGARYRLLDAVGHLPCIEVPEVIAELLLKFVKENTNV